MNWPPTLSRTPFPILLVGNEILAIQRFIRIQFDLETRAKSQSKLFSTNRMNESRCLELHPNLVVPGDETKFHRLEPENPKYFLRLAETKQKKTTGSLS